MYNTKSIYLQKILCYTMELEKRYNLDACSNHYFCYGFTNSEQRIYEGNPEFQSETKSPASGFLIVRLRIIVGKGFQTGLTGLSVVSQVAMELNSVIDRAQIHLLQTVENNAKERLRKHLTVFSHRCQSGTSNLAECCFKVKDKKFYMTQDIHIQFFFDQSINQFLMSMRGMRSPSISESEAQRLTIHKKWE